MRNSKYYIKTVSTNIYFHVKTFSGYYLDKLELSFAALGPFSDPEPGPRAMGASSKNILGPGPEHIDKLKTTKQKENNKKHRNKHRNKTQNTPINENKETKKQTKKQRNKQNK